MFKIENDLGEFMKGKLTVLVLCAVWFISACGDKKKVESPANPVPVEETLTDPTCKDEAVRLCLHRFPAPDVERKNYEKCLSEEYAECLQ